MNELEKCMAGEYYDCHNEIFLEFKDTARNLLTEYNSLSYHQKQEKRTTLEKLFGSIGTNVSVGLPFICDYGRNIHIGTNVSVNMNCTFVDCNKITIGDNVLIASNVQLYTAAHPVELSERLVPDWKQNSKEYFCRTYALPITIGSGCWLGGGVIVLPGVTIGNGSVIGAGSVVTKDIPANSVAVGNPCRVIRQLPGNASANQGICCESLSDNGSSALSVKFYETIDDDLLQFAVVIARSNGKWVYCKHKERDTFEIPGGHREKNESISDTAKRELYEETGALSYSIVPVCV